MRELHPDVANTAKELVIKESEVSDYAWKSGNPLALKVYTLLTLFKKVLKKMALLLILAHTTSI